MFFFNLKTKNVAIFMGDFKSPRWRIKKKLNRHQVKILNKSLKKVLHYNKLKK